MPRNVRHWWPVQLDENDVRALCRRFGCRPYELGPKLEALFDGALTDQLAKGQLGLDADALVAAGSIEVGHNPDRRHVHRCVACGRDLPLDRSPVDTCGERCYQSQLRGQRGAVFHSIEGRGDWR